jgi:hypothetical protein
MKEDLVAEENGDQQESEDEYKFDKLEEGSKRPSCSACGDPVKIIVHSGGTPMAAQHCRECYAELRWGKIPKHRRSRR